MTWLYVALGFLAAALLYAVLATAKREDRDARHTERSIDPFSDVDITLDQHEAADPLTLQQQIEAMEHKHLH